MNISSLYRILVFCATGMAVLTASAEKFYVKTVDQLTNAVSKATSGDSVILRKSGSPYRFASDCRLCAEAHLTSMKNITLCGETGNPDDVVIEGNANRILYFGDFAGCSSPVIKDLTFRNGDARNAASGGLNGGAILFRRGLSTGIVTNCVFYGNFAERGGAVGIYQAPKKDSEIYSGACIDCVFSNNTATTFGGAVYGIKDLTGCLIQENTAGQAGGGVYQVVNMKKCELVRNTMPTDVKGMTGAGGGGAYVTTYASTISPVIDGCWFIGNYSTYSGGGFATDIDRVTVTNCWFEGNAVSTNSQNVWASAGGVYNVKQVVDCIFTNNCAYWGGAARDSVLVRCGLYGNHALRTLVQTGCYAGGALDCELSWCTNRANTTSNNYAEMKGCRVSDSAILGAESSPRAMMVDCSFDRCRFEGIVSGTLFGGLVAITNSLIAECGADGDIYLVADIGEGSTLANCTIVGNRFKAWSFSNDGVKGATIENTLFYGNTINGNTVDLDTKAPKQVKQFVRCIFSSPDDAFAPGTDNLNYFGLSSFNPRFVGAAADPVNPYALKYSSPARKKEGTVYPWMASTTDIMGQARLREGKVDIGCYQCWSDPVGLMLLFK